MHSTLAGDNRKWRAIGGWVHRSLIVGTLVALFVFAPLRSLESGEVARATVIELPEQGSVLWLNPNTESRGQKGESFIPVQEESHRRMASR